MSRTLFLSPHNDDETLFGGFIIQQELPEVWVMLDGIVQRAVGKTDQDSEHRRKESMEAVKILMGINYKPHASVQFGGFTDIRPDWKGIGKLLEILSSQTWGTVYAPYPEPHESAHDQHNELGKLVCRVFGNRNVYRLRLYTTYTRICGKTGKATPNAKPFLPTDGGQVQRKLQALACYRSQMDVKDCREHFTRDLNEYVVEYKPGEMWWEK